MWLLIRVYSTPRPAVVRSGFTLIQQFQINQYIQMDLLNCRSLGAQILRVITIQGDSNVVRLVSFANDLNEVCCSMRNVPQHELCIQQSASAQSDQCLCSPSKETSCHCLSKKRLAKTYQIA